MSSINKSQARDLIRRDKLGKLTSCEEYKLMGTGVNKVGYPATSHPFPTNEQMNSQMALALAYINRKCNLGFAEDITYDVSAQTANGAYVLDLRDLGVGQENLVAGDINQIRRVYWEDSSGNTRQIQPRSRNYQDTGWKTEWQSTEPLDLGGFYAAEYWTEGYKFFLLPAPASAGTLHFIAGTGILFAGELAVIDVIPTDFHDVVWDCVAWYVARAMPNDVEMVGLAQQYQLSTRDGIADILEYKRDLTAMEDEGVTIPPERVQPYRSGRRILESYPDWRGY